MHLAQDCGNSSAFSTRLVTPVHLAQDCGNSITNALELPQSSTKSSIYEITATTPMLLPNLYIHTNTYMYTGQVIEVQLSCYTALLDIMTSLNGNILRVTGLCVWNSPVTGEFLSQRPVTWSFDVFFDLHLE